MAGDALVEDTNALAPVVAESLSDCGGQVEDATPVAGLVPVDLHAPFARGQDGAERAAIEDLALGEAAGAWVFQNERRATRKRAMRANQLAGLDGLVRARQPLAGQVIAGVAKARGHAAIVVQCRQAEEGGDE